MPKISSTYITKNLKSQKWDKKFILSNIDDVKKSLGIKNDAISDDDVADVIVYTILQVKQPFNKYKSYLNSCMDFSMDRFVEYTKKRGCIASATLEFYKLKYGKFAEEKFKQYCDNINAWNPENYAKRRNISLDEAKSLINNTLKNKSTSLQGFIKRHGKEEGQKKYNKWLSECDQSLNGFIKRYGEVEGAKRYEKWIENLRKQNPRCEEYWLQRGVDSSEVKQQISNFQLNHAGCHEQFWINRVGTAEAKIVIDSINKRKDSSSLAFFIKKYGDTEEAYAKYDILRKKKDAVSIKSFISRGHTLAEAEQLHKEAVRIRVGSGFSKESILFFDDVLSCVNAEFDSVKKGESEHHIYDENNKCYYLYDLTLFKNNKKCIIEYHGVAFHPRIDLSESDYKAWRSPYSKETAAEVRARDLNKRQLAQNNGFEYMEIWSNDLDKKNSAINFIKTIFENEN
jgi:hypothetical protein